MHKVLLGLAAAAALTATAPSAFADSCKMLTRNTNTYCGTFAYSTGGSNQYTVTFGPGNSFNLNGDSPGTFTCPGKGFVETDYSFGGSESQQWYGKAPLPAGSSNGYGKSLTNGYLYKWNLSPGGCARSALKQGRTQADSK